MTKKGVFAIIFASSVIGILSLFFLPRFVNPFSLDPTASAILFDIRLPRVLAAVIVGASLGASGAILQGILRNPLADPYVLGLSSGASFFAAFALMFTGVVTVLAVPTLAFVGSLIVCALVGTLASRGGKIVPERLLLSGIGLGFLFTAALMLLITLSSDAGVKRAMLWMFGDLSSTSPELLPFGFLIIATGMILSFMRASALNALTLGDELAHSLGFSPSKERLLLFVSVSLMTAASVALGGIIGFVGLLVPHIVRMTISSDARMLLPLSAVTGAALLTLSDAIGRSIAAPIEVPSGIITAIIGAPYFLYLLRKKSVIRQ